MYVQSSLTFPSPLISEITCNVFNRCLLVFGCFRFCSCCIMLIVVLFNLVIVVFTFVYLAIVAPWVRKD